MQIELTLYYKPLPNYIQISMAYEIVGRILKISKLSTDFNDFQEMLTLGQGRADSILLMFWIPDRLILSIDQVMVLYS